MTIRSIIALAVAATLSSGHTSIDPTDGSVFFERLKQLEGRWAAQTRDGEMVNVFRPIAFGSAVLHEEWLKGEQITATVFYLVGTELRADHFCDFKNQLRYVGHPVSDSSVIKFELKEAINLDVQPRHFHSTVWRFGDATHLGQEWEIVEPGKAPRFVRMEFTRKP
jgi:hypothetical protein